MTANSEVTKWVDDVAKLTTPDRIHWCDGSAAEHEMLVKGMLDRKEFTTLNRDKWPGCYLYRSDPTDVARTEKVTYINCANEADAGPTNNWLSPAAAEQQVLPLFKGAMQGRTMYVIPYIMGPVNGVNSRVGFEITDSPYVTLNMRIMTRMGQVALDRLGNSSDFVKGMHSIGDLKPEHRAICHFPERNEIWSVGSGYGGNALLGKKCHALRIATSQARREGWMAEHMLILGLENPQGEVFYIAAAFPSQCGKTNLAMVIPPDSMPGWKAWTVGDDIAWIRVGDDGRLWAMNPEAGFFGVAPGTSMKTNANAMLTAQRNSIFTNVALVGDDDVWWEGMGPAPATAVDWQGRPWTSSSAEKAAHPNARFTTPAAQCPSISKHWEDPQGVPLSAILFGGRRPHMTPLVMEAYNWNHGVLMGASVASETTAAATEQAGVLRHDPMAMLPFCGYHMGDYFAHWVNIGTKVKHQPKLFTVNWFRAGDDGKFLWPGYGDNVRVLKWVLERCQGRGEAVETPIGFLPKPKAIDTTGINVSDATLNDILSVDNARWKNELVENRKYFSTFGNRFPSELTTELDAIGKRLG
ncbi:phosphoenolpyruvate carboxykinase (GTP) [candidate division KSB1 bacterium]|nr:phosphoenolpyruvate carboxykinase (GTP) [candidate division KSB1 bacterium]